MSRSAKRSKHRERGSAFILFTMMTMLVLLPMLGLAIDGGVLYWAKAKLSSAVDASALATGRSLSVGQTISQQIASATAVGQAYFRANFPPGLLGSTVVGDQPSISIVQTAQHLRTVTVQASVTVPLYFARIFGQSTGTVSPNEPNHQARCQHHSRPGPLEFNERQRILSNHGRCGPELRKSVCRWS